MSGYVFPTCRACAKREDCRNDYEIKTDYMSELLPILQFAVRMGAETGRVPDLSALRDKQVVKPVQVCAVCGKQITGSRIRYCSDECRMVRQREQRRDHMRRKRRGNDG